MEIGGTQKSRDDRTSASRSFGSNYQPCSQSRKISIGIIVDSLDKWRPKSTNMNEVAVPCSEKTIRKLNSVGDISKRQQAKANSKANQIDQARNTSPWVTTKSTHSMKPTAGGTEFNRSNVENSEYEKSGLQPNNDNFKKLNRVYCRSEAEVEGERESAKALPSATAEEVFVPEREEAEDKTIRTEDSRQVLRMKIREILGTNSTQNKQASQAPDFGGNNLNPEVVLNKKCEASVKPKQCSDPIESDSQSPDHSIKRAVMRLSTRKKVASKTPTTKTRNLRNSTSTKKSLEKNAFSFNEGQVGKVHDAVSSGSPKYNEKSLKSKGPKVEARRINFSEDPNAGDVQKKTVKSKTTKGPEKTSSIGNSMKSYQKSPLKNRNVFSTEKGNKENGFSLLSAKNKGERGSKGEVARFSFAEKLVSDEVQPATNISEPIKGANKASSIGSIIRNYQNFPPQSSSRLVDAELSSSMKRGKTGSKAEADSSGFPGKQNVEEVQLAARMEKATKDVENTSSTGKRTRIYGTSPPENNSKFADLKKGDNEKDLSLAANKKKPANMSFLGISHRWAQKEDFSSSPFKSATGPHVDLESPTSRRTPAEPFSPCSPPKANHGELDDQSPEYYCFKTLMTSKPDNYTPDTGTKTSNDTEEDEDTPRTKSGPTMPSGPTMAGQDADDAEYRSSPEKMDTKSSKAGWAYPDIGTKADPEFVLYPNKRLRFSPLIASPKGLQESDESRGPPEKNGENGLSNAVSLLTLALQQVKSKIKKATSKKCTEVLMSVAEEVHLHLQNAEPQFERDMGKLTSLGKSKRKHLETEIEEQQEQLKVIYQKFKEDVSQYIQKHRSKVEGLQEHENELRLFMEKRKASQREVLKQVEESIQAQLNDAETKIAAVHKMGRDKMLQLKQALGTCLEEGMLG